MAVLAKAQSLEQLFQIGQFEPALTQRAYEWDEKNWRELLNDLVAAFSQSGMDKVGENADLLQNETAPEEQTTDEERHLPHSVRPPVAPIRGSPPTQYFLGQIVLLPRRNGGFYIYDGQQRLTSLTLLLCALRDTIGASGDWQPLQELLRTPSPENSARMTLGRSSHLSTIVDSLGGISPPESSKRLSTENQRLYNAASFFKTSLRGWGNERIQQFTQFLRQRVIIVVTQIDDRRLAETAYVTINTRGMPLSNADILKGHLVQFVAQYSLETANEIARRWDSLTKELKETKTRKPFDDFLQAVDFNWFGKYRTSDFGLEIMDQFRDEADIDKARHWVFETLPWLLTLYKEVHEHLTMEDVEGLPLRFRKLNFLPWKYWVPIAMMLLDQHRNGPERKKIAIKNLERWGFLANLMGWNDEAIARRAADALGFIHNGLSPFSERRVLWTTTVQRNYARQRLLDGQFDSHERRRAHVQWLEMSYWENERVPYTATDRVTVEHVLPRRASKEWSNDFPEHILIYAEKIGNLCLIPSDDLGASYFPAKRDAYRKLPPLHRSAHDVAAYSTWNAAAVDERTDRLMKIAIDRLGL